MGASDWDRTGAPTALTVDDTATENIFAGNCLEFPAGSLNELILLDSNLALSISSSQEIDISDALQKDSAIFNANADSIVRVSSDIALRVDIGASPTVTTTSGARMPAEMVEYFVVPAGEIISLISEDGVSTGRATLTVMA